MEKRNIVLVIILAIAVSMSSYFILDSFVLVDNIQTSPGSSNQELTKNSDGPQTEYERGSPPSDQERDGSPLLVPFSVSLGAVASLIFVGITSLRKREIRGDATSILLEEGLENLSIRDAEIFSQIMRMGEFTIPQLKKRTETSKVTTWRTVKKFVEEGLVRKTDRKRAPSRGLGGRGKPSQVYEYVGREGTKT